ncbi:MAG TPA: SulP family inorganic anion transporter [Gemmatimonadales bacterium]|nr:SulP family inorganic anion transporter [Gemmatimonadales bacterium]
MVPTRGLGNLAGDAWGGLAAMLVALPSAIAYGVTIYAPLGGTYAAYGALAGMLGATALGLVAPALGGTNRLITAPCAPAAAVLSALAADLLAGGVTPESALLLLALIGAITGLLQVVFGLVGLGRLIKYMPYPVVSGYLSGVGLIIIATQVPKLLGAPKGTHFWASLGAPNVWEWRAIAVGAATMAVMVVASRLVKVVPAAILGLLAGLLTYGAIALVDRELRVLENNHFIVGPLQGAAGGFSDAFVGRLSALRHLASADYVGVIVPALTLAVLLSIDTLKTCVVLDAITRSRHDSNRELLGQGCGNLASALIGGVPGAGTMGATLVNLSSGATTRRSGVIEGALALVAFLALGPVIAWVPVAALAGILIVVGARMIDRRSLHFLRSRSTVLDFAVIAAVVVTALSVNLIAASGVGVALAVGLFVREQIGGTVVRRQALGNQRFSKRVRLPEEMEVLRERGDRTVILELQGSLFFGTADQLSSALEAHLERRTYVILDMRRVQSVDVTAAHVLELVKDTLAGHQGFLVFSAVPHRLPTGQDVRAYFGEVGLVRAESTVRVFDELDAALEWVEDRILEEARLEREVERPLELKEIGLFAGRKAETLTALEALLDRRSYRAGEAIFKLGDTGDDLFLIRRGSVRIMFPLNERERHHVSTFGRGDFFGEMAFLDRNTRSADAIAFTDTDLFVLSRANFDRFAEEHKRMALQLLEALARALAIRLRYANTELRALQA